MEQDTTPEAMLKTIGLTEYELKAFMTLVKFGVLTAEKISELAQIPLPRVYDTVGELQKKGLVLAGKTRPKRFKANPVEKALAHYIDLQKKGYEEKIENLRSNIKKVSDFLSSIQRIEPIEEGTNIWSIQQRKNIIKLLDEQKKKAKKEIIIFSGDLSWINHASNIIKNNIKRCIKMRAIAYDPASNVQILKNIQKAKKAGIQVRTGYKGNMRGHIIDSKIAAITVKYSKEGVNIRGEGLSGSDTPFEKHELIVLETPVIVSLLKENFEFWWNKLSKRNRNLNCW